MSLEARSHNPHPAREDSAPPHSLPGFLGSLKTAANIHAKLVVGIVSSTNLTSSIKISEKKSVRCFLVFGDSGDLVT